MILYKYYGYDAGIAAMTSHQLGFRKPVYFNDPFELTALSNGSGPLSKQETLRHQIEELKEQVVILSLTRSPNNPLMWAHYGRDHTGFVIGYDVRGDFLNSQEFNLIPAEAGDVIYTHTKSPFELTRASMDAMKQVYQHGFGATHTPTFEQQSLARRLFLTKHASWVYEEEVRIVKLVDSLFEENHVFQAHGYRQLEKIDPLRPLPTGLSLYKHQVPIHSVYLGARNTMQDGMDSERVQGLGCAVFQLGVNDTSWDLEAKRMPS